MLSVAGKQLQKAGAQLRVQARTTLVSVTYGGRPKLVVLSVEDNAMLRPNRKLDLKRAAMSTLKIERIAGIVWTLSTPISTA